MIYKIFALITVFGLAFSVVYRKSDAFFDWLRFQSIGTRDQIVDTLSRMFIQVNPQTVLIVMLSLSGIGFSVVFLLFLPRLFPGFFFGSLVGVLLWKIPGIIVRILFQRRLKLFVLQMVDGLNLVANGLRSGLSLIQAFGMLVEEMPHPISQEFNFVLNENKLGLSVEESLNNLVRRVPADDVKMFVTAINILKETGGNLAEVFDTIVQTIRDRIKVENRISTLVASSYNQGMVIIMMPGVMGLLFYASDPQSMQLLFAKPLGWFILLLILGLESLGYFFIVRIVTIDV
jgi:tight adherence protein B